VIAGSKSSTQAIVRTGIAFVAGWFAHRIFGGQWVIIVVLIVALYALGFAFRPLLRNVAVSERGLTIQNARERISLSWDEVVSVDVVVQPRHALQVTTSEGRIIELEATRGRKNIDEIADRIRAEAQAKHG
jgi:hypothetical protein